MRNLCQQLMAPDQSATFLLCGNVPAVQVPLTGFWPGM